MWSLNLSAASYPSRYTGPSVLDRKQQEELLADAARQQRATFVSRKPTRPPQFNPHASLFFAQKTAQQVGSIFRATQLSRKKAMTILGTPILLRLQYNGSFQRWRNYKQAH
jgi:hypothetical protein